MKAFARAAETRRKSAGTDFVEAILHERPDLAGKDIYRPVQGDHAHVVFIGDEVFKAPYSPDGEAWLDNEIQILKWMEGKGLPVPQVTYAGKEFMFFGMTRVPGVTLGLHFSDWLKPDELKVLACDIIDFTIKMAKALPQRENGAFVMHEDLHANNILIDPKTKKFSGVIDFESVAYRQKKDWHYHSMFREPIGIVLEAEFERRKSEIPDPPRVKRPHSPAI